MELEMLEFSLIKNSVDVVKCIQELSSFLKDKKFDDVPGKVIELENIIFDAYSKDRKSSRILKDTTPKLKETLIGDQAYYDSHNISDELPCCHSYFCETPNCCQLCR